MTNNQAPMIKYPLTITNDQAPMNKRPVNEWTNQFTIGSLQY